jgi:glycine cleavage system regulatory protein
LAIQAIGKDRPGLVADITEVICEHFGCNVEGATMNIVGGHFSSSLIISKAEGVSIDALRNALAEVESGLHLHVSPIAEGNLRRVWREATHEVTVESDERPGLIHEIACVLSHHGVNIASLASSTNPQRNRCTVWSAGVLPGEMSSKELEILLEENLNGNPYVDVVPVQAFR